MVTRQTQITPEWKDAPGTIRKLEHKEPRPGHVEVYGRTHSFRREETQAGSAPCFLRGVWYCMRYSGPPVLRASTGREDGLKSGQIGLSRHVTPTLKTYHGI